MSDDVKPNVTTGSAHNGGNGNLETLAVVLGASMKQIAGANDAQQIAILALTAIVACSPTTASLDLEKLGVALKTLTMNRSDSEKVCKQVADYVSLIVGVSRKLPDVLAQAKTAKEAGLAPESVTTEKSTRMN